MAWDTEGEIHFGCFCTKVIQYINRFEQIAGVNNDILIFTILRQNKRKWSKGRRRRRRREQQEIK